MINLELKGLNNEFELRIEELKNKYCELSPIVGIDLKIAKEEIFSKYMYINTRGYNKEIGGIVEDLVAFSFNTKRPTTKKGADFLFGECKSVKSKRLKDTKLNSEQIKNLKELGIDTNDITNKNIYTTLRNTGNPPIAIFNKNVDFFDSILYKKLKTIIFVYHIDNIIEDIRIFDGMKYMDVMKNDYELIKNGKNSETKILTLKNVTQSIQMKKFMDIFLSESISYDVNNNIDNQFEYIFNLFFEKLYTYKYSISSEAIKRIEKNEKKIIKNKELIIKSNNIISDLEKSNEEDRNSIKYEIENFQINMKNEYNRIINQNNYSLLK